jgi:hypothetical protein
MPSPKNPQPIHEKRSLFDRFKRFVKNHPVGAGFMIAGIVIGIIAIGIATGGIGFATIGAAAGITAAVTVVSIIGSHFSGLGTVFKKADSDRLNTRQKDTGNPEGKYVQDYVIVNGRRFGESRSADLTQRRFYYVTTREKLVKYAETSTNPAIQKAIDDLDKAMNSYERRHNGKKKLKLKKNFSDILANDALISAFKQAAAVIKSQEQPAQAQPTSTTSIARSMGGPAAVSSPKKPTTQTSFNITRTDGPLAQSVIVKKISDHFGKALSDNHERVRDGFAERLAKLQILIKANREDTTLTNLHGKMVKTIAAFEKKYQDAVNQGDKSIVEPAAAALKQTYSEVDLAIARRTPSTAPLPVSNPALKK